APRAGRHFRPQDGNPPRVAGFPGSCAKQGVWSRTMIQSVGRTKPGMDKLETLRGAPLFRALSDDQLARLAAGASVLRARAAAGGFLFQAGEPARSVFLVVPDGGAAHAAMRLQIEFGSHAASQSIGYRLGEGEVAGELEFLLAGSKPETGARIGSARVLAD